MSFSQISNARGFIGTPAFAVGWAGNVGAPGPRPYPRGVGGGGGPMGLGLKAKPALSVRIKGLRPQLVGPESPRDIGVRET